MQQTTLAAQGAEVADLRIRREETQAILAKLQADMVEAVALIRGPTPAAEPANGGPARLEGPAVARGPRAPAPGAPGMGHLQRSAR